MEQFKAAGGGGSTGVIAQPSNGPLILPLDEPQTSSAARGSSPAASSPAASPPTAAEEGTKRKRKEPERLEAGPATSKWSSGQKDPSVVEEPTASARGGADDEDYWFDPWPAGVLGRKPPEQERLVDPCGGLDRGELPDEAPELDWQRSVEVNMVRNESGLRHLHDSGYDFEVARAGIVELLLLLKQSEQTQTASGASAGLDRTDRVELSGPGYVTRRREQESRRMDEAMKRYGKDFEQARRAIIRSGGGGKEHDSVTVGELVVHYYSKWKHSKAYKQWIDSSQYRQQQRSVALAAQSGGHGHQAGMIAGAQSDNQKKKKAQRKQRRREKRQMREEDQRGERDCIM